MPDRRQPFFSCAKSECGDERYTGEKYSIDRALRNFPRINPQIYPQAIRLSRLALVQAPHYLGSRALKAPIYGVFSLATASKED